LSKVVVTTYDEINGILENVRQGSIFFVYSRNLELREGSLEQMSAVYEKPANSGFTRLQANTNAMDLNDEKRVKF
jgi:hypothetical protein